MCLGKPIPSGDQESIFELHGFRRCGIYSIFQIVSMLCGFAIIASRPFGTSWIINLIIGCAVIAVTALLPNGRPFFVNLQRMGRVYIVFDGAEREIHVICTKFGGLRTSKKLLCSYSQFRGIAVHYQSKQILLLCRREESLLLKQHGEVLPAGKRTIEEVLEEIMLFWFQRGGNEGFFGITHCPFSHGIVDSQNVKVDIQYDFYLKRSETWKPKNDIIGAEQRREKQKKFEREAGLSPSQEIRVHPKSKGKNVNRFESVDGACVDLSSDNDSRVVDYV